MFKIKINYPFDYDDKHYETGNQYDVDYYVYRFASKMGYGEKIDVIKEKPVEQIVEEPVEQKNIEPVKKEEKVNDNRLAKIKKMANSDSKKNWIAEAKKLGLNIKRTMTEMQICGMIYDAKNINNK